MKRALLWLNPKTGLRGLVFGFLFGFVYGCGFEVAAAFSLPAFELTLQSLERRLRIGFAFAIPWTAVWACSGIACHQIPGHPGTLSTLLAFACATAYTLHTSTFGGWMPLVIIFNTSLSLIPCHMLGFVIAALFGRIRDPDEAA